SRTVFVDKLATGTGNGSISSPYANLNTAMGNAKAGDIVRVIGNAGADGDAANLQSNQAYELGYNPLSGGDLPDGSSLVVKKGVTLMVDAGVVIKSRRARIARGSDSSLIDLSGSAIQMLGTPRLLDSNGNLLTDANGDSVPGEIYLTSLFDKEIGLHTTAGTEVFDPAGGDWGGIDLRDSVDADRVDANDVHVKLDSEKGEFVDLINHVTIQYGGGSVVVGGSVEVISPIHLDDALPTITHNTIQNNASAAISASPNSFLETRFNESEYQDVPFTPDYSRVGPEVFGNTIVDNSVNGMLLRIATPTGNGLNQLEVAARFDDTDIVHVITENLVIDHGVGGPVETVAKTANTERILAARYDSSLVIDPGTVVKLDGARIEMTVGTLLLAEGNQNHEVVLTSLRDTRYGAGGTFDTTNQDGSVVASSGDWSGVYASPFSNLSVDHAVVAYGGGVSRIEGAFAAFNAIEVRDANARITRSRLEYNESGFRTQDTDRNGRGETGAAVIFVTGDQPVIADNTIQHNLASAISMGVNDLNYEFVQDAGRQTVEANSIEGRVGNQGPLVQGNVIADNALNAMLVRGGTMTTEGVWDDTDIVHVVVNSIHVPDFHTYGGLRLESSPRESLVVKLADLDVNNPAGFTANGKPLDIDDRIGGSINIVGQPHYPVVLTSIADDTVGAGYTPSGQLQTDTANDSSDIGGGGPTVTTNTEIVVNLGVGIAAGSTLALRVDDAITILEELLHDPISLSLDMDTGALPPGVIGGMYSTASIGAIPFDDVRSAMVADGTTAEQTLLNQLPTFDQLNVSGGTAEDTVYISQANAKALESLDINGVTFNRSGSCWTMCDGYFVVSNTFDPTQPGTVSLIVHEIAHSLGFVSAVNNSFDNMSPLDMFRIAPGAGAADFTNATRILNSGPDTVFHDGIFDPVGITGITGLTVGDIPMSTGADGDGNQPSHFKHRGLIGDVYLGVMDPILNPTPEANGEAIVKPNDISVLGLIGWDVDTGNGGGGGIGNTPSPGDWDGIKLLQFSNDRNLALINERESDDHAQPIYENFDPASSQFVGQLAVDQFAGDELARLGFEIQGTIEIPTDEDMYRFEATAGTEIWLDIDRTEVQLDTVIELLDSVGRVLYRSDNSGDASTIETDPNDVSSLELVDAQPLKRSVLGVFDNGTTNAKDAGMRLLLPGAVGQINTYHVRVLSADKLIGGSYQLQVRLQELDEEPGSSIQFADIRYATGGVEIVGLPIHSPLAGEVAEDQTINNDTPAGAQSLGNILQTDRSVISVAGNLSNSGDVDFYTFDVSYEDVQTQGTGMAAIFDLDYADGFARANTNISIFNDNGELILVGSDSNIADDRPRSPLQGSDLDDLSRGTIGPLDPFVGTVELPVGSYTIAISNETRIPAEMEQFYTSNATNPLLRLEPINSIDRIVEERFDGTTLLIDDSSLVPYFLGDVVLFVSADVSTDAGLVDTSITTIDGFTGKQETTIHEAIGYDVQDIALRSDGFMFGFTVVDPTGVGGLDADVGNYLQIGTGDGSIMNLDATGNPPDDGVFTFQSDGAGGEVYSNHGIHYDATVFENNTRGFVVGHRPEGAVETLADGTVGPLNSVSTKNILYQFDANTGDIISLPPGDRSSPDTLFGAGTNKLERGVLDTKAGDQTLANKLLLTEEATTHDAATNETTSRIEDGDTFCIDHDGDGTSGTACIEFEFNSGPEVIFDIVHEQGIFLRDGDAFNLDSLAFEFNTGPVFVVNAVNGSEISDGETFSLADDNGTLRTFEFDKDGEVLPNNESVIVSNTITQDEIITAMVNAINASDGFNLEAAALASTSNRITLTNDSTTFAPTKNADWLSIFGDHQLSGAGQSIEIEENDTNVRFGQNMADVFAPLSQIQLGIDGKRMNFLGAQVGSFTAPVNRGVFIDQNNDGSVGNGLNGEPRFGVPFLAQDSSTEIATRILTALFQKNIEAVLQGSIIQLTGPATVARADDPLLVGGTAPGGDITGMAFIGDTLYAVSDEGGFYTIDDRNTNLAKATYIASSAGDLQGKEFQGLTAGPANTEGGRYANLLFGIVKTGEVYAFDTSGALQPVFIDGASSIATGIDNVNGLNFSTIDFNPWRFTEDRSDDDGHGRLDSYDGTQFAEDGGTSLHFEPIEDLSHNIPGGAHGSIETNPFSLKGYSADDLPTLYFNYYLETENALGVRNDPNVDDVDMMDSFRVFVADESGEWTLLSTNNSFVSTTPTVVDELDLDPPNTAIQVQETFDNTGDWRQARVDLSSFAGSDQLKLRFDFSSAGDTNTGDPLTTGTEFRAIKAADLRDGETFSVDGVEFEIDLGFTLVAPTGAALKHLDSFTLDYGFGVSQSLSIHKDVTPAGNNTIVVTDDMTASQVALAVETAIVEYLPRFQIPFIFGIPIESNDTLLEATFLDLKGMSATCKATQAQIGDNPLILDDSSWDVDMVKLSVEAGTKITVDIDTSNYGNQLNSVLRVFDSNGDEVAISDNDSAPGELPSTDSYLEYTATVDGDYFIAVSGFGNSTYDPTDLSSRQEGSKGQYDIEINVDIAAGLTQRQNNRINFPGAKAVTNNSGFILEGTGGESVERGVEIHAGMDQVAVASAVQLSLANAFANGELGAFPRYGGVIRIIGHAVDDQGPFGLTTTMPGDEYGNFEDPRRGQDSALLGGSTAQSSFEGVYIDDIIIGFAERGEMATGANGSVVFQTNDRARENQISTGEYQLELRRGTQHVEYSVDGTLPYVAQTWDTNDRLGNEVAIRAVAGYDIVDGNSFTVSDGYNEVSFEFNDSRIDENGDATVVCDDDALDNHITIICIDPSTGKEEIALLMRDAINDHSTLNGAGIVAGFASGLNPDITSTDHVINLDGPVVVDIDDPLTIPYSDTGDDNARREQGQVVIGQNVITDSLGFGISMVSSVTDANGNPHQGPVRVGRELNTFNLLPGVVVTDNILAGNVGGGISLSGNLAAGQTAAVPFARIINNTIIGDGSGVGIEISNNASPTLLNNIVADLNVGLDVDASSITTVIGGTVFANNATDATVTKGDFPIDIDTGAGAPLFQDSANGNYYLAPGALAIDSAIDSVVERDEMHTLKTPLGIADSPIIVSTHDALGQRRVDDPSVATPTGIGHEVFKDRGAIDRSDFIGPQAVIVSPLDNTAPDRDAAETIIEIRNQDLEMIAIQLVESENSRDLNGGSGVLDSSVQSSSVTLFKDGVRLEPRFDYIFEYDSANDIIRLIPLAGKFSVDSTYLVELTSARGFVIQPQTGDQINDGEMFTVDDKLGNSAIFEFDSGYAMQVPAAYTLTVPAAGGSAIVDGETFTITSSAGNQVFEFTLDLFTQGNALPVGFAVADDADEIAQSISDALAAANINLLPHVRGDGEVHVGSSAEHTLNSSNTVVTQRGVPESVFDGDYITVDNGSDFLQMEFDTDGTTLPDTTRVISITPDLDNEQIANLIVNAVHQAALGLSPTHVDDGQIHVGGDRLTVLDASNTSVTQLGEPGTRTELGLRIPGRAGVPFGLVDGETLTITNSSYTVTFELDNDSTTSPGNRPIAFSDNSTLDQVTGSLVSQVNLSNLSLTARNLGDGFVELEGSTLQHTVLVGTSGLTQIGFPGVEATVPVNYLPFESFDENQMGIAIAAAINGAPTLTGVTAIARTDSVIVSGASSVSGTLISLVSGIEDRAGNSLYPNQLTGDTTFEINLSTGRDWGDAKDGHPVTSAENGANHLVVDGFHLGSGVDVESDGTHSPDYLFDDDDELPSAAGLRNQGELKVLQPGRIYKLVVEVNGVGPDREGVVDAWIDYNHDRSWNGFIGDDPTEIDPETDEPIQIAVSEKLEFFNVEVDSITGEEIIDPITGDPTPILGDVEIQNGENRLWFRVPPQALGTCPSLRMRLSSEGGLLPTGPADDGEVEDYQLFTHNSDWHNIFVNEDVNKDGFVSAIDALMVINYINAENVIGGTGQLPAREEDEIDKSPLVDVNNDGFASAIDAIRVINVLNNTDDEGEGEDVFMAYYGATRVTVTSASIADLVQPASGSVVVDIPAMASAERVREAQFAELDLSRENRLDVVLADIGGEVTDLRDSDEGRDEFFASVQY
ncbi:MAG: hypothetical protein HOB73_09065, partial [Planctomycetaceae bacterium]|nr:hypothetical protein [Planctomycetaceae bacterium]